MAQRYALGITGASGAIYAVRTLVQMAKSPDVSEVQVVLTDSGYRVVTDELFVDRRGFQAFIAKACGDAAPKIRIYPNADIGAPLASGSSSPAGMAIVPCSMGSLAALALGLSNTLMRRGADVMLKERRPLVVVPREAPYNLIHLDNMKRLLLAGAHIVPASPGFYHHPKSIDELCDQIVAKVLDLLGVGHAIDARWKGTPKSTKGTPEGLPKGSAG